MEIKVKYDYAFKLECVKLVLEKQNSYGFVSKLKGAEKSNILRCIGFYKQHGKIGLIPRINQSYTVNFKLKVLQSIDEDFLSLNDTYLKFNIPLLLFILNGKELLITLAWRDFNKN